jgi:NADH-quinone oxidoreductase subunit M
MVLAALYVLWLYQRVMQGPVRGNAMLAGIGEGPGAATDPSVNAKKTGAHRRFGDLSGREIAVLAPLVALILVLGIYPKPVLDVLTPSVGATLTDVGVSDPVTVQGGK